ncbi:hypothetical protein DH2020_042092 [Rehmannia glutinosa]|uniref:Uncharacterized protein n=1 Tax=Rehmannia glutinosa TaxID=99300 RepID=A0ABR0UP36_REHGL
MEPEDVLNLFDSKWFHLKIFEKQSKTPISEPNPNPQIEENPSKINVSRQLTIHTRSKSDDQLLTSFNSSPNPLLQKPHLQTIFSEREISLEIPKFDKPSKGLNKKKKRFSKSLSELEFEEMKGFMDLGFVFSEEDKDSNLVEIIPGLQKLGREQNVKDLSGPRARPYLSEAWESPLMKWRFPAVSNEIDMKDSLKWWAHSVASAVR